MNRNAYHYDLFRPRDQIEVQTFKGHRGHGEGEFRKATVTKYVHRWHPEQEAWKVVFTFDETGESGTVTLDNHFEEVRLLHRPEELEPDGLCPVCRLEVGYECFSICCDRCDNWVHGACDQIDQTEGVTVKKYYCPKCVEQYGLLTMYKNGEVRPRKRKHKRPASQEQPAKKVRASSADEVTPRVPDPRKAVKAAAVHAERECAYTECSKLHRNASKYCCPEHGRAQAEAKFKATMARRAQEEQAGDGELNSPKAKGMTRADAEDLAEFNRIQSKIKGFKSKMAALDARRKKHEQLVEANKTRTVTSARGEAAEGGTDDGEGSPPKISPKSADGAKSKDSWMFDCPTCGKQACPPPPCSAALAHTARAPRLCCHP